MAEIYYEVDNNDGTYYALRKDAHYLIGLNAMTKIFISYSRVDRDAIAQLVEALLNLEAKVFWDINDIQPFDPIHERIDVELEGSTVLLAWYSEDYARKPYCQWELRAAWLTGEAKGNPEQRILVVNPIEPVRTHIQPTALKNALYAGIQDPAALAHMIIEAVRKRGLSGPLGSVRVKERTPWFGRPLPIERRFVGRSAELWKVHSGLKPGTVTVISTNSRLAGATLAQVQGLGGVGKTMLAEEYALRFERAWPTGVFWLSANQGTDRATLLSTLHTLAGEFYGSAIYGQSQDEVLKRLRSDLGKVEQSYLWIIDDWPHDGSKQDLEMWCAPGYKGHTLVTTRDRRLSRLGTAIDLDCLEPAEALILLASHRAPHDDAERETANVIAERLGWHPLALDVAGAVIAQDGYSSFLDLLNKSCAEALTLSAEFEEELPTGHERDIVTTLEQSLKRLDKAGLDLLRLASQLAPRAIPRDLLTEVFALADGIPAHTIGIALSKTINQIALRSLLRVSEKAITVHVLVCRALEIKFPDPKRSDDLREAAVKVLRRIFSENASDIRRHEALVPLESHATHITADATDMLSLFLLGLVGRFHHERAAYHAANNANRKTWRGFCLALGPEHPLSLTTKNNFAQSLKEAGNFDEARSLEEQVLEQSRRIQGQNHPQTLIAMNNLADILLIQGRLAEAAALTKTVLDLCYQVFQPDDAFTIQVMHSYAWALQALGQLDKAINIQKQVLLATCRKQGQEHKHTLSSMNNLSWMFRLHGALQDARILQERVLEIRRRIWGPEHPDTIIAQDSLAQTLREMGELASAQAHGQQALSASQRLFGPEHIISLTILCNLALTLLEEGDQCRSRTLLEPMIGAYFRVLGSEHPVTLTALNNLALALHPRDGTVSTPQDRNDLARARTLSEQVLEASCRVLGPEHRDTLDAMNNLAMTIYYQGDMATARALQENVLEIRRRVHPLHPNTFKAQTNLAMTLVFQGDFDRAEALAMAALQGRQKVLGEDHPDTLRSIQNLEAVRFAHSVLSGRRHPV